MTPLTENDCVASPANRIYANSNTKLYECIMINVQTGGTYSRRDAKWLFPSIRKTSNYKNYEKKILEFKWHSKQSKRVEVSSFQFSFFQNRIRWERYSIDFQLITEIKYVLNSLDSRNPDENSTFVDIIVMITHVVIENMVQEQRPSIFYLFLSPNFKCLRWKWDDVTLLENLHPILVTFLAAGLFNDRNILETRKYVSSFWLARIKMFAGVLYQSIF